MRAFTALICYTLSHLTSMICLENSHSKVAGNSSSTRTSVRALRIDTGVSVNFTNPINFPTKSKTTLNQGVKIFQMEISGLERFVTLCLTEQEVNIFLYLMAFMKNKASIYL